MKKANVDEQQCIKLKFSLSADNTLKSDVLYREIESNIHLDPWWNKQL